MKRHFLLVFCILLSAQFSFAAISSQEALDFASKTNNFLLQGESAEISPNVKISSQSKAYWAVAITGGDSLTGLVPVSADSAAIPDSKTLRKDLIKTGYFLYNFDNLKKNAVQQDQWIFNSLNSKRMNDLALRLQSEASLDLSTVEAELKDSPALLTLITKIKSGLGEMNKGAAQLSRDISDAGAYENSFYNNPDTAALDTLKAKFDNVFSEIEELDAKKTVYVLDSDKLKQGIAQTSLPIETKKSLGSLASPPAELAYLSAISTASTNLNESISNAFDDSIAHSQTLADNLETRIKRNSSYQVMYGQDNAIIDKTGYQSLSDLIIYILAEENADEWQNSEQVSLLRENWQKATAYFKNGNFETASSFAEKAKKNALAIYTDGFAEQKPAINTDLLITAAVLIIAVLIIIVILRNRGKLASLVSVNNEGEKNDFQ
ncbi:MAG: hypothetical protein PHH08_05005 [Candidatus ainarchaeum sp.]|nr:hypothetical protein [Candidatus ainarchaeum sp.]